jgi:hypothetical protein
MSVRDEYAGTERRCPKCKGKFRVPAADAQPSSAGAASGDADEFDPVAFLTGEKTLAGKKTAPTKAAPTKAAPTKPAASKPKAEFDPLDVLTSDDAGKDPGKSGPASPAKPGKQPPAAEAKTPPPAAAPPAPALEEFDPLDVLGAGPKPPAAPLASPAAGAPAPVPGAPAAPGAASSTAPLAAAIPEPATKPPEKPQPRRPSWAKSTPAPEVNDWDTPAAAPPPAPEAAPPAAPTQPEKAQPRRPSWAKAAPPPEVNDWEGSPVSGGAAGTAAPAPTVAPEGAADLSPAAQAAATAMGATIGGVSADNPALQAEAPREPRFNRAAMAEAVRRRLPLAGKTAAASAVLFALSWWLVAPRAVEFHEIGTSRELTLAPVTGRVTVDQRPVAGARVMFHPRGPQFRSPEGFTDADGRFALQFCEGRAGAPAGRYRVQLQLIGADGSDVGVAADQYLRERTFNVAEGRNDVEIAIDTKAAAGS